MVILDIDSICWRMKSVFYECQRMVPEQEALVAHEVILADAEPKPPQPRLFNMIMRDYEESPPQMMDVPHELDDLDKLDDPIEANYVVDEWFPEDGSNDRD
jgi:hypothetical protein